MSTVLEQKALCALRQYSLFSQGDRIAVGVSGGADSVALLRFLAALRPQFGWDLVVCHIQHGLRGAEADRDEVFVRALAEQLGLPCAVSRIDAAALALRDHISVEEAGRMARYAFFAQTAGEGGRIATAHTLDDSIETVLMNLVRGTGLRGLCGIPRIRGNIVRPLLDCTRAEVEDYLGALGQPYCTDSTNLTDDYTRNRIRHDILPRLCALNPNFSGAMARMLPRLAAQQALTDCLAAQSAQQLHAARHVLVRDGGQDGGFDLGFVHVVISFRVEAGAFRSVSALWRKLHMVQTTFSCRCAAIHLSTSRLLLFAARPLHWVVPRVR